MNLAILIVATGQYEWVTYGNADSFDVGCEMSVVYEYTHVSHSHSHFPLPFLFTFPVRILVCQQEIFCWTCSCYTWFPSRNRRLSRGRGKVAGYFLLAGYARSMAVVLAAGRIDEDVSARCRTWFVTCQIECADSRTCPTQRATLFCLCRCRLPAAGPSAGGMLGIEALEIHRQLSNWPKSNYVDQLQQQLQ